MDKSIILTKTAPNDNAKSISVQCAWGAISISAVQNIHIWAGNIKERKVFEKTKIFIQNIILSD